ncbi:MAG: alpha/beta fold hydrolase [Myxococcota bacterium]
MTTRSDFSTVGGSQPVELELPETSPRACIVVAPALGVRASYYRALSEGLRKAGFATAAVDLPGLGQSPVRARRGVDWGYDDVIAHYAAACRALRQLRPDTPLVLLGHSIGGQVGLMLSGTGVDGLEGVVIVASGCPWWKTWDGLEAWRIRAATWTCGALARTLGVFPGDKVGFGGRDAKTLITQWAHAAQTGHYRLDSFDGDALLARPGPPVLAIRVEGDAWVPERSMQLALGRMTDRDVRTELWRDAPHGGNHNRWPSEPGHVVRRVAAFADDLNLR